MLKFVVLLCAMLPAVLCLSEEMEELIKQLHDDCQSQTGIPEDLIDFVKAKKGFPDDPKLRCYVKCLMAEMAVIDEDGVIDVEAAIAVMPEEVKDDVEPTMRKCGSIMGADACESAWLTHKCYYDTDAAHYIIV